MIIYIYICVIIYIHIYDYIYMYDYIYIHDYSDGSLVGWCFNDAQTIGTCLQFVLFAVWEWASWLRLGLLIFDLNCVRPDLEWFRAELRSIYGDRSKGPCKEF